MSELVSPSREIPGLCAKPWATSCELTCCRLDVDVVKDDWPSVISESESMVGAKRKKEVSGHLIVSTHQFIVTHYVQLNKLHK